MIRRRSALAALATGLSLTGCLSSTREEDSESIVTDSPESGSSVTPTTAAVTSAKPTATYSFGSGGPVTPTAAAVTSTAFVTQATDQIRIVSSSAWFLFVRMTIGTQSLSSALFSLDYGERQFESHPSPFDLRSGFWDGEWIGAQGELEPGESEWIVFALPRAPSSASPRLVLDGTQRVTWPLPPDASRRLRASPPTRRRVSVSAPDTVTSDEPIPITFTATNEQDQRGYVLIGVNHRVSHRGIPIVMELAPGETQSVTYEPQNPGQFGASAARYRIVYHGGSRDIEVPIRDPSETATDGTTTDTTTSETQSQWRRTLGRSRR